MRGCLPELQMSLVLQETRAVASNDAALEYLLWLIFLSEEFL
jgi:hypothetical protein